MTDRTEHASHAASRTLITLLTLVLAWLTVAAAPASAHVNVPLPSGYTTIYAPCPGAPDAGGCAYADRAAILAGVWGDACRNPSGCVYLSNRDRFNRFHELGHVWDAQVLTDSDRAWFARLLGFPRARAWLTGRANVAAPGEQFADAYANCALGNGFGRRAGTWETAYDYNFQPLRHRQICAAITILGLVRG